MNRFTGLAVTVLSSIHFWSIPYANGCAIGVPAVKVRVEKSDVVVLGKILSVRKMKVPQMDVDYYIDLEKKKMFKGEVAGKVRIFFKLGTQAQSDCFSNRLYWGSSKTLSKFVGKEVLFFLKKRTNEREYYTDNELDPVPIGGFEGEKALSELKPVCVDREKLKLDDGKIQIWEDDAKTEAFVWYIERIKSQATHFLRDFTISPAKGVNERVFSEVKKRFPAKALEQFSDGGWGDYAVKDPARLIQVHSLCWLGTKEIELRATHSDANGGGDSHILHLGRKEKGWAISRAINVGIN